LFIARSFSGRGREPETGITHGDIGFLIEINFIVPFIACDFPKLGAKRWRRLPTTGNGLRNVLSGHALLQITVCASNTPAWVEFGLSVLRRPSAGPTSLSRNQRKKWPNPYGKKWRAGSLPDCRQFGPNEVTMRNMQRQHILELG